MSYIIEPIEKIREIRAEIMEIALIDPVAAESLRELWLYLGRELSIAVESLGDPWLDKRAEYITVTLTRLEEGILRGCGDVLKGVDFYMGWINRPQ